MCQPIGVSVKSTFTSLKKKIWWSMSKSGPWAKKKLTIFYGVGEMIQCLGTDNFAYDGCIRKHKKIKGCIFKMRSSRRDFCRLKYIPITMIPTSLLEKHLSSYVESHKCLVCYQKWANWGLENSLGE